MPLCQQLQTERLLNIQAVYSNGTLQLGNLKAHVLESFCQQRSAQAQQGCQPGSLSFPWASQVENYMLHLFPEQSASFIETHY